MIEKTGAPEEIRTPDPQIRSLVLWSGGKGDGESPCRTIRSENSDCHSARRFGNSVIEASGTTPNPSL